MSRNRIPKNEGTGIKKARPTSPSVFQTVMNVILWPFRWISKKITRQPTRRSASTAKSQPSIDSRELLELEPSPIRKFKKTGEYTLEQIQESNRPSVPQVSVHVAGSSPVVLQPVAKPAIVPSSRINQFVFLFVGLDSSGTSETMTNLFKVNDNSTMTSSEKNSSIREVWGQVLTPPRDEVTLKIIDAPGLCKDEYLEQDAELITALENHLKQSLPNQIPTVTFLVTRFDDNRFEGEVSEVTRMFSTLSHIRKSWTDSQLSNVILVLTHSQKVSSEFENIDEKLSRFQETFHNVFPPSNNHRKSDLSSVPCVLVDNLENPLESRTRLLHALSKVVKYRERGSAISQAFLNQLSQDSNPIFDNPQETLMSVESLLPQNKRGINELLDLLLQVKSFSEPDDNDDEIRPYRLDYFPSIEAINPLLKGGLIPPPPGSLGARMTDSVTILPPNAKLMLADGKTEMLVQNLSIGDKLLDKDLKSNVITSINIAKVATNSFKGKWVGRIYVETCFYDQDIDPGSDSDSSDTTTVLKYRGGRVRAEQLDLESGPTLDPEQKHLFFILELDKPDGTFIADGYVMYHEHAAPNFKGSRTKL